ncbi:MAG TPA: hypothetical protein VEK84_11535 [Terriglobales bacterium]|nr:hypothetical protein [Terriglobales bacterium]
MIDRRELHKLIDSLPDDALESAQTYLRNIQVWPPKPPEDPPEVVEHRKKLEAARDKFLAHRSGTSYGAIDGKNKIDASYGESEWNHDRGEDKIRTFRVHQDFPLEITEGFQTKNDGHVLNLQVAHLRARQGRGTPTGVSGGIEEYACR